AIKKAKLFADENNSIIFGCAGLLGMMNEQIITGENSLFGNLFGEIVQLNKPCFANLMMSKICF
ncbi:MAG: hypothetical protein RR292_02195, partial [Christensenellaceae bacterium]